MKVLQAAVSRIQTFIYIIYKPFIKCLLEIKCDKREMLVHVLY